MDPFNIMELGYCIREHAYESYEAWKYWALRRKEMIALWTDLLKPPMKKPLPPPPLLQSVHVI